VEKAKTS